MADDSLSVLSLNPKEDEQLTETAFAERTFFFPRENLRRLFIRFAPFCSFRQQKAKMPQNRDSEAKKGKEWYTRRDSNS